MSIDQITEIRRKCGTTDVDLDRSAGGFTFFMTVSALGHYLLHNWHESELA